MPQNSTIKEKSRYFIENMPAASVITVFSSRDCGNMSLSYGDTSRSLENRKVFLSNIGCIFSDLVCAKQVHGNRVVQVNSADKGRGALSYASAIGDTDALIADQPNLPLAVLTADCLPIFIYDRLKPAVALVHAGWRSTKEKILTNTINLMRERFNSDAKELYLGFGPSLRSCCYEVGEEFRRFFNYGLEYRSQHYYLDLAAINRKEAKDLGVKAGNIFDSRICTWCRNDEFFSFRKEGASCGRTISLVVLR